MHSLPTKYLFIIKKIDLSKSNYYQIKQITLNKMDLNEGLITICHHTSEKGYNVRILLKKFECEDYESIKTIITTQYRTNKYFQMTMRDYHLMYYINKNMYKLLFIGLERKCLYEFEDDLINHEIDKIDKYNKLLLKETDEFFILDIKNIICTLPLCGLRWSGICGMNVCRSGLATPPTDPRTPPRHSAIGSEISSVFASLFNTFALSH